MRNEISIQFRTCLSTSLRNIFALVFVLAFAGQIALAQTSSFTYQGRVADSGVAYNDKGDVEGVKYDRLSVAFVNAFKEQQTEISGQKSVISYQQLQIEDLDSKIKLQQEQIDALIKLLCSLKPEAEACKKQ